MAFYRGKNFVEKKKSRHILNAGAGNSYLKSRWYRRKIRNRRKRDKREARKKRRFVYDLILGIVIVLIVIGLMIYIG